MIDFDKKNDENVLILLNMGLALEDYEDNTKDLFPLLKESFSDLGYIYEIRKKMHPEVSKEELFKLTESALIKFNKVFDIIGRDKFTFNENNRINYNWNYSLKGGKNND
jgi:hypothetical protein